MPDLVAIDLPAGPEFVDVLQATWDAGDAVFPVDQRVPDRIRTELMDLMAPTRLVTSAGNEPWPGRPVESGDALVMATGGTTGTPRGVVLTHEAVRTAAVTTSARLKADPVADRWLACLPLSHMGGLMVVIRSLVTGVPLDVMQRFEAEEVTDAARRGATLVSMVASMLRRVDGSLFRTIVVGGGPKPETVPTNAVVTYGMTETSGGMVYDGIPVGGSEVRVVDGDIELRGPTLLRCYRDGSDPKDRDGWLRTSDVGSFRDGRLVVSGRKDDVIITGGENVWPQQVEARLATHPAVVDVAVVGRPDPEWGQLVTALIVAEDPGVLGLEALRDYVKKALPAFMAPREIEYVDHLPRTSLGKLRRDLI